MKVIRRIDDGIARVEGIVVVVLVLGIVAVAMLQTILRNALDSGLEWADEALRWATLWVAFLGASLATHRGKHIAIDVASRLLPKRLRRIAEVATGLAAALTAAVLAWGCWRFVREIGTTEPALFNEKIPRWPLELVVPFTFAIMSVRFLLHAIRGTPESQGPA